MSETSAIPSGFSKCVTCGTLYTHLSGCPVCSPPEKKEQRRHYADVQVLRNIICRAEAQWHEVPTNHISRERKKVIYLTTAELDVLRRLSE